VLFGILIAGAIIGMRVWRATSSASDNSIKIEGNVISTSKDDPDMLAAVDRARRTVTQFTEHLARPRAGEEGFSIKIGIKQRNDLELIWLGNTTFDGVTFHGVIDEAPASVRNVKVGDRKDARADEIYDWMYIADGKLVGGETIRALRNKMRAKQRADFDKDLPFTID
jgi:uncharacterized protein YegJ (DUF2314 family)